MSRITLEHLTKRFSGGVCAVHDLTLDIADGEFLVLVGPSGCGKTTALRMIAGLESISEGTLQVDGTDVGDVPERDRDMAMVFQSYALYPHMTVAQNIGFSLRLRRVPHHEIRERVREVAHLLALEDLLDRRPKQLSGGQRQRVAMGRALVRRPRAFLMDEPLSNLDAKLRVHMRGEIAALQERLGITTVYVTHDQVEAMTMGDRVAVIDRGELQQVDTPAQIYDRPANVFVAGFIGSPPMNLLHGRVEARGGGLVVAVAGAEVALPPAVAAGLGPWAGREVIVGIRPEDVEPASGAGDLLAPVVRIEAVGSSLLAYVQVDAESAAARAVGTGGEARADAVALVERQGAIVCAALEARTPVAVGDPLALRLPPERLHLFDPDSERAIRPDEGPSEPVASLRAVHPDT